MRRDSGKGCKYFRLSQLEKEAVTTFLSSGICLPPYQQVMPRLFCYATLPIAFDILLKRDCSIQSERSIVIVVSPQLALMGHYVSSFSSECLEGVGITWDTTE